MAEKEKLSFEQIEKEVDGKKEIKDKVEYLKKFLSDKEYEDIKKDITILIVPFLTDKNNSNADFRLSYDSLNEGLEPIYFWILDFMRDSSPGGLGLDVKKGNEMFEASVSSGYFGEIGQRASLMQQKAVEYIGAINQIVKSVLNLIYDLKEFEIRIEAYDHANSNDIDVKNSGMKSLKGIWMDQVDARKGRGSINLLTQDLQFVTLRDAFFYYEGADSVKKADLNDRVKQILTRKLEEFNAWHIYSEKEIRKRYEIEKIYLKSQVGSLRLYTNWVKPYLIAAQKLKMRGTEPKSFTNPNIVNSFSNMEMEIKLYGKKEITPAAVHPSLKEVKLNKKYYAAIEVLLNFRSVPSVLSGQGGRHYVHGGRTDISIRAFVFDNTEIEALENFELYEDLDLIENYIGTSLKLLEEELSKYLEPQKEEKKDKKPENSFKGIFPSFKTIFRPVASLKSNKQNISPVIYDDVKKKAMENAERNAYLIYNVYKKTHGMINI